MLHFLSRAMGEFIEDKDWGLWIGSRNCGKGCINTLLFTGFNDYITSIPSSCILCSRVSSTDIKLYSSRRTFWGRLSAVFLTRKIIRGWKCVQGKNV